jgi:lipase (class 3)
MQIERLTVEPASGPFPIYADPIGHLLRAHVGDTADRDASVAHLLGVLSGYAYSDTETVAMMAGRLGMSGSACVRVVQAVDAMTIFSTAYLLQSPCGRVVILFYRGTEPANLGNWLGDADVGSHTISVGGGRLAVHAGFDRNVSATRWPILELLKAAARGESIARSGVRVDHPMEALYVAGHSLGGAMAVLFALRLAGSEDSDGLDSRLRAIYTFGQPLATGGPLPEGARVVGRRLFRHVHARDVVPSLPPAAWGALEHFGQEFHYANGEWRRRDPAAQLSSFRDISRSVLAMLAPVEKRGKSAYTIADHGPHHYVAALRPAGKVTEFGDRFNA